VLNNVPHLPDCFQRSLFWFNAQMQHNGPGFVQNDSLVWGLPLQRFPENILLPRGVQHPTAKSFVKRKINGGIGGVCHEVIAKAFI
jgi:hypothetical protein